MTNYTDLTSTLTLRPLIFHKIPFKTFASVICILSIFKPRGVCLHYFLQNNLFFGFGVALLGKTREQVRTYRLLVVVEVPQLLLGVRQVLTDQAEIQMRDQTLIFGNH